MQVSPDEDRYLPAIGDYVKAGQVIDVPAEVGESLVEQDGWHAPKRAAHKADKDGES